MKLDRRRFLARAGLGAAGLGAAGAGLLRSGEAEAGSPAATPRLGPDGSPGRAAAADANAAVPVVPFHGEHQAGILTPPPPPSTTFVSYDVTAADRRELVALMKTLTSTARFLTAGGSPPELGTAAPPSDNGTLGDPVPADGLTVIVGLGHSLFDDQRYGLGGRPIHLTPMRTFPNDDPDLARTGGDLLLQICSGSWDTTLHALRQIARATRGAMQINWRVDGSIAPSRPSGVPLARRHRRDRRP